MPSLIGKKILILSPQPWSEMKISKHHYAIQLAQRDNKVFFLNPPSAGLGLGKSTISRVTDEGISIIDYRPLFPMRYKYKANWLFNRFITRDIQNIITLMGGKPDIVWDFEPNRQFADLNVFGAKVKIYHPVDATPIMNGATKNAHVILSVSDVILDYFKKSEIPTYFINHGLGDEFASLAKQKMTDLKPYVQPETVQLGYVGNLLMKYIDHPLFKEVITRNPTVRFHIWGPHDTGTLPADDADTRTIIDFIDFLKAQKNVVLYGMQPQKKIIPQLDNIDGFFWCYDSDRDPNKGSNSHKILEYLSTGKVLVSTYISTYAREAEEEVIMMAGNHAEYHQVFNRVINNLPYYNNPTLQFRRMEKAMSHTYARNLSLIDEIVTNLV